jgi:hypothetical protein
MFGSSPSGGGFPILPPLTQLRPSVVIGTTFAADVASQPFLNLGGFRLVSFFITVTGNASPNRVQCALTWRTSETGPDFEQVRRTQADPGILELDWLELPAVNAGDELRTTISAANPGGAVACLLQFRELSGNPPADVACLARGST